MKLTKTALLAVTTLLFASSANADAIRCGSHVIEAGDIHEAVTMQEVLKKCGQPSSRKGSVLYYKKKGKRLDFDTSGNLMSTNDIEEDEET